jgi:disease resistance protein RPM1
MIQPAKLDALGNVKTCRVHDIVHDIAVSISSQDNHVFLVEEHTSSTTTSKESIRHISCYASSKLNIGMDLSCVRSSFTVFGEPFEPIASLCSSKFKMLRVLDLKNAGFRAEQQDIRNIGLLVHLKYLHFPNMVSDMYSLPRCIGNLQALQTLDIRKSSFSALPTNTTKLQNLRRLRCSRVPESEYLPSTLRLLNLATHGDRNATAILHMTLSSCWSFSSGIKVPKGVGSLKGLQILEKVDIKRTRPCLDVFKIPNFYFSFHHIKSLNTCMEY